MLIVIVINHLQEKEKSATIRLYKVYCLYSIKYSILSCHLLRVELLNKSSHRNRRWIGVCWIQCLSSLLPPLQPTKMNCRTNVSFAMAKLLLFFFFFLNFHWLPNDLMADNCNTTDDHPKMCTMDHSMLFSVLLSLVFRYIYLRQSTNLQIVYTGIMSRSKITVIKNNSNQSLTDFNKSNSSNLQFCAQCLKLISRLLH